MRKFSSLHFGAPLLIAFMCVTLFACGPKDTAKKSPVAATVNGENITEADVDFMIGQMFSQQNVPVDDALRHKVLESLISSRAIKQAYKKEIDSDELDHISRSVKAYEEELFVKEYLQRHVTAEPVTEEMVQKYYAEHPEQFGAEDIRDFEFLKAPVALDEKHRDALLNAVPSIRTAADWQTASKVWKQEYELQFFQGRSKAGLLDKTIEQALQHLKKGETSDVIYVDGQLHLLRVTNITPTAAKSLTEVSGEIRKKLAPLMLRNAVKKISDDMRASAKVQFSESKK